VSGYGEPGYAGALSSEHRAGPDYTLTERQKLLARAGGMTYREYYELLNNIPKSKL
jgi:hypothetical protein